ncbi:MAG: type II toxin-antitoxin system Phd/YefM family antitoxin [Acidimicrobiales bacterium]
MYMTTLPVADARANLSKLIDEASSTHERFEITRNGRRAAVLLGAEDYDALSETIAVLSDPVLLHSHNDGQSALDRGDYLDIDQLASAMKDVGRLANDR